MRWQRNVSQVNQHHTSIWPWRKNGHKDTEFTWAQKFCPCARHCMWVVTREGNMVAWPPNNLRFSTFFLLITSFLPFSIGYLAFFAYLLCSWFFYSIYKDRIYPCIQIFSGVSIHVFTWVEIDLLYVFRFFFVCRHIGRISKFGGPSFKSWGLDYTFLYTFGQKLGAHAHSSATLYLRAWNVCSRLEQSKPKVDMKLMNT